MDNNLLLQALKGANVERPPVWMMRQAGRYLPDFMKLKEKYDFFTRCQTPELATEITLMPIDQIGVDAAIIFSDILVVLQAMNIEVEMRDGIGPYLPNPIKDKSSLDQVILPDVHEELGYVFEAVKMTKKELNNRVPLIGFAGAPFTLASYAIEGRGSRNYVEVKKMSVGGTTSEGMLCDSKMLNWAGGAEGLCVQVPPSFSPGDSAPTSKPRMDGGTTPVVPDKSDKELKAEAKAAKKAEAAAKKEARKTKKLVGKSGNDEVDQTAEDVSKIKMEE